jgi:hypothetical protein
MAIDPNRIAGEAEVTVDGQTFMIAGDFKYSPASVKRETLTGQDQVHGYKETPRAPFISCSVRDAGSMTVNDFNGMVSVTISAVLSNGKQVIGRGMWTVEPEEVDTQDAKFEVKWEGLGGCITEITT